MARQATITVPVLGDDYGKTETVQGFYNDAGTLFVKWDPSNPMETSIYQTDPETGAYIRPELPDSESGKVTAWNKQWAQENGFSDVFDAWLPEATAATEQTAGQGTSLRIDPTTGEVRTHQTAEQAWKEGLATASVLSAPFTIGQGIAALNAPAAPLAAVPEVGAAPPLAELGASTPLAAGAPPVVPPVTPPVAPPVGGMPTWVPYAGIAGVQTLANIWATNQATQANQAGLDQAAQSQQDQLEFLQQQADQNHADMEPWREAGTQALTDLQALMSGETDITTTPGYQFRLDEGLKGVERAAAARGGLVGGRTLKELTRYGQDYASTEFNNRFNQLASIAGLGTTGQGMNLNANANFQNQVGNSYNNFAQLAIAGGQNQAANYLGTANAVGGSLNNLMTLYWMNQNNNNNRG